jgi:hypothetical protein
MRSKHCLLLWLLHAGVAGYAWVAILHELVGLSFMVTLLIANIMPAAWLIVFRFVSSLQSDSCQYKRLPLDGLPSKLPCSTSLS